MVSIMSSTSGRNFPALMSLISTSDALCRSTGCPSRATFKMDISSLHQQRQAAHPDGDEQRDERQRRAAVKRASGLGHVVQESGDDRTEEARQRADAGRQAEHAA